MRSYIVVVLCVFLCCVNGGIIADDQRCRYVASKGVIDLNPLTSVSGEPRFKDISGEQYMYSWNPCSIFTERNCLNAEICQLGSQGDPNDYVLGRAGESHFEEQAQDKVYFVYQHTSEIDQQPYTRTTRIELVCSTVEEGRLQFIKEDPLINYQLTLTSKYACPAIVTPSPPAPPTSVTKGPRPAPTPAPGPGPDIFNMETITILLACILLSLVLLVFMVFVGLLTRR